LGSGSVRFQLFHKAKQNLTVNCYPTRENIDAIAEMVDSGDVKVVTDKVNSFEHGPEAVVRTARRRARG
jgi:NADPH:quinone reductase-like Zn-dependent oxidoreductase